MGKVSLGINLEFVRHEDKPFEWGVEKAAALGYEYVEPMVHWGRELLSEAGCFHSFSMLDGPYRIKRACTGPDQRRVRGEPGQLDAGPEIGTEYLKQAIRFAAECGEPVVNIEPHQQYSKHPAGLERIFRLVDSAALGINFDTGNAYLCGHDPHAWLESVVDHLIHLHAKDISTSHADEERGKVTGTPVGCACGDGVIDWRRVIALCREAPRDIVLSVECGTVDQAQRSLRHFQSLLG